MPNSVGESRHALGRLEDPLEWHWRGWRQGLWPESQVPPSHIVPGAMFIADVFKNPNERETHCLMQTHTGGIGQGNTGIDVVKPL